MNLLKIGSCRHIQRYHGDPVLPISTVCIYIYIYIYVYIYIYIYIYTHTHTYIYIYIHMYTYIHTYIIHTYIHTYTHIYIYILLLCFVSVAPTNGLHVDPAGAVDLPAAGVHGVHRPLVPLSVRHPVQNEDGGLLHVWTACVVLCLSGVS